jgi:hypothetical protein
MILTLLLVQHIAGHVDGMDTSVAPADDILAGATRRRSPRVRGTSASGPECPKLSKELSLARRVQRLAYSKREWMFTCHAASVPARLCEVK